ncbi:type VI secretion system-associated FHA domain protein TagH [Pararhodobacter sp. SW119]|uniref:type VI secretion system-associated FHA domain protein TagH n=1 Tax=Pararhodobacter sp. SW119 TaxID=2780075 RepID=UPI001AE06D51|nr:type VI secretion system-associated FHA domain protein TagH [Pararhodobacter sp. SW119]
MAVVLKFLSTGSIPGSGEPVRMIGPSLTIGRGSENDLVLPDPDRLISKAHCVIEDHGGQIVVIDLSTNGTFLNYGKVPLGQTPTPLNEGDVLSMGTYELVVSLVPDQAPAPPADHAARGGGSAARAQPDPLDDFDKEMGGGDFLDDLLDGGDQPKGPANWVERKDRLDEFLPPLSDEDLLGPAPATDGPAMSDHGPGTSDAFTSRSAKASQIPDDWDDLLAPDSGTPPQDAPPEPPQAPVPPRPQRPAPPPPAEGNDDIDDLLGPPPRTSAPAAPPPAATPRPTPPASPEPPPAARGDEAAARAFLAALGAEDLGIPDAELEATMARLGATMRVMIEGLREVLMTRSSIKSEFRIEQTRISAGGNNPLKFSVSPDQAIEAMVRPRAKGYLAAQAATEQALDDIKAHEVAMVTGMEAALRGILQRLDPATLAGKIEAGGGISRLLKGKKALYWETYEKMYAEISDQATNDFHEIFSREFANAYGEQLEKLKTQR